MGDHRSVKSRPFRLEPCFSQRATGRQPTAAGSFSRRAGATPDGSRKASGKQRQRRRGSIRGTCRLVLKTLALWSRWRAAGLQGPGTHEEQPSRQRRSGVQEVLRISHEYFRGNVTTSQLKINARQEVATAAKRKAPPDKQCRRSAMIEEGQAH